MLVLLGWYWGRSYTGTTPDVAQEGSWVCLYVTVWIECSLSKDESADTPQNASQLATNNNNKRRLLAVWRWRWEG